MDYCTLSSVRYFRAIITYDLRKMKQIITSAELIKNVNSLRKLMRKD